MVGNADGQLALFKGEHSNKPWKRASGLGTASHTHLLLWIGSLRLMEVWIMGGVARGVLVGATGVAGGGLPWGLREWRMVGCRGGYGSGGWWAAVGAMGVAGGGLPWGLREWRVVGCRGGTAE